MIRYRVPVLWVMFVALVVSGVLGWRNRPALSSSGRSATPSAEEAEAKFKQEAADFTTLLSDDPKAIATALDNIEMRWHDACAMMLLETAQLDLDPDTRQGIFDLLRRRLNIDHGDQIDPWRQYLWQLPEPTYEGYVQFKSDFYGGVIDEPFAKYFSREKGKTIRLDEVVWRGLKQDEIRPLNNPSMLSASEAAFIPDRAIVLGLVRDGRAKAYPKRLLAQREVINDRLGADLICVFYCKADDEMTVYNAVCREKFELKFGCSGFRYGGTMLMYDKSTSSLWSPASGKPVVGVFAGRPMDMTPLPAETTTWGEWKAQHPKTLVVEPTK